MGTAMKIRRVAIDTHPENTAFLLREGNGYSPEQFQALRKIEIGNGSVSILATLAIVDDNCLLEPGQPESAADPDRADDRVRDPFRAAIWLRLATPLADRAGNRCHRLPGGGSIVVRARTPCTTGDC